MESGKSPKLKRKRQIKQKLAVALKHDLEPNSIPRVTATGRGKLAEKILEAAFANNVKVRQDADLAEVLSALEIDWEIPIEAFAAVAEILSYVYRANGTHVKIGQSDENNRRNKPRT